MKTAIYQYWYGSKPRASALAGSENMKNYAERIGAEYIFAHDPPYYGPSCNGLERKYSALRPIYDDEFLKYDKVLYVDLDVFATDNWTENIFEEDIKHIGICEEPLQPYLRTLNNVAANSSISNQNDNKVSNVLKNKYGKELLREEKFPFAPRVFNSGVVLFTREGLIAAREKFIPPGKHIQLYQQNGISGFYLSDQNYYRAMMVVSDVDFKIMDYKWNSQIHYVRGNELKVADGRTALTNFVHVQISGADSMDADAHRRMVNLPVSEWNINNKIKGVYNGQPA